MMDLNESRDLTSLAGDVCVIGAGAAGISLARRLLAAGHEVILLESGGLDYEKPIADLAAGENVGLDYYELEDTRLRFFGGTTAIWGGRCAEFDPIDLEKRDYVPHSGWPIGWDELEHYYREARPLFDLPDEPLTPERFRAAGVPLPRFDADRLATPLWTFDRRFNRFTFDACEDLRSDPRCRIVTHATVTEIKAAESGTGIAQVEARSLAGATLTVKARTYVLAAGGIENARLLLASRSVMPDGLGNAHDQVGRYFMEHPHARGGRVVDGGAWQLLKAFGRRHRIQGQDMAALIAPSEALQRREGILNTSLTIVARQPEGARQFFGMKAYSGIKHNMAPTRGGRALWMTTKKAASWAQRHVDPARPWLLNRIGNLDIALLVRAEQAPNPDSRVMLTREADATGMPRVALDWRLSEIDTRSVAVLIDVLGGELKRLELGRVEPAPWLKDRGWRFDPLISSHPIGGYHHLGTTRMGSDPRTSVTDGDGRVHGIGNLYVAGSSLFPTGSWANPTLTIVALALRTADRIAGARA
ncbi:FAD-dependent oxidoreductase [Sphingosinicella humi]|uniref:GMC family oxidoreductase n=1 Tax=Allosphingosinicella humi TaxID=2068657 RepID=A0A2U2J2Z2_9SPHN|nr:GMC family oxidoreductase [Sphingosinicella humi]PWG02698.1 GMC family oxidoreductase [Sphingosinicella humi]